MSESTSKMQFQPGTNPILTIVNDIKNVDRGGLDLQPSYQRGYIWKKDYKDKLIYSLFNSYPIGSIIIRVLNGQNDKNPKNAKSEVVDGQQRLTTINNFINDEFLLENEISRKIIDISKEYFYDEANSNKRVKKILDKYLTDKKIILKFSDLPERLKGNIHAVNIATITISNATTEQVAEYFRFVQNQERLRAGEIIESFPDTMLEQYITSLEDKDKLLKVLKFEDDRKEFEKIFYGMIGIFDKKIKLGSTDYSIKEYVSNKNTELDGEALKLTNLMIKNLNKISRLTLIEGIKSNKRMLKFIMLLCAFEFIDFSSDEIIKNNIIKLNDINIKLSSFNSAKKEALKKNFGSEELAEKYRPMSLIVKGAHNFDSIKIVMDDLGKIIQGL